MSKKFYTSDTHFGHKNVIKYCNRPWSTIEEMTEGMIARWNERVMDQDIVYHLGDFAFMSDRKAEDILRRLKGQKYLIRGNHDNGIARSRYWSGISDYRETNDGGKKIIMCHYAFAVWNKSQHGSINLFGHSHGSRPGNQQQMDVGVDVWDYRPVTIDEILAKMVTLEPYKQGDYHRSEHSA